MITALLLISEGNVITLMICLPVFVIVIGILYFMMPESSYQAPTSPAINQLKLQGHCFIYGYVGNMGGLWLDGSNMKIVFHKDNKCDIVIGVSSCDDEEENTGHWDYFEYKGTYTQEEQDITLEAMDKIFKFKISEKGIVAQDCYDVKHKIIPTGALFADYGIA